ncbi:MAG: hypothetical protein LH610_06975 [Sphingomonas bacterium]|nr:hypothetical protein [Sphingomonas bacterium]
MATVTFALATLAAPVSAQGPMQRMSERQMQSTMASWPANARMAAADMMKKYGPPQEVTATMVKWHNNGPWKYTIVSNKETPHRFPMAHPDVMEQGIDYRVPVGMFDDLAAYDGSVTADRTQGHLAARCDKEGANFLAVNLAHDIITKRKNVASASAYYGRAMAAFKKMGRMNPYMQRLQFTLPRGQTADADVALRM